jgi:hypothetical protein
MTQPPAVIFGQVVTERNVPLLFNRELDSEIYDTVLHFF